MRGFHMGIYRITWNTQRAHVLIQTLQLNKKGFFVPSLQLKSIKEPISLQRPSSLFLISLPSLLSFSSHFSHFPSKNFLSFSTRNLDLGFSTSKNMNSLRVTVISHLDEAHYFLYLSFLNTTRLVSFLAQFPYISLSLSLSRISSPKCISLWELSVGSLDLCRSKVLGERGH